MALAPTRFSRVSVGWVSSTQSIADVDAADTGAVFSITGDQAFTGDQTVTGALTVSSTASFGGNVTATGGLFVGSAVAANEVVALSSTTVAVNFGSVGAQGSSSVTIGVSSATNGDLLLVQPGSNWSGDYGWLQLQAVTSGVTAGEVNFIASNISGAAINPDEVVFRVVRLNFPSFA